MRNHKRIKEMPLSDRPMERLFKLGAENIAMTELFAILLGTGTSKYNAVDLANAIIRELPEINTKSLENYFKRIQVKGFGNVKKARFLAAVELGKRLYSLKNQESVYLKNGKDVIPLLSGIGKGNQEKLYAFYINARNELIKKELIAQGTLNITRVSIRDVLANAFIFPCASLIIAHNHPSGDPSPSDEDIVFTDNLQKILETVNILFIDHIILGSSNYFSFYENSLHTY